jgi:hypothetical protein
MTKDTVALFPDTLGVRSGYLFTLRGCEPTSNNPKYQLIAIPREPGKSGFRAFCSDESGYIYDDAAGSGEQCLQRKKPIS